MYLVCSLLSLVGRLCAILTLQSPCDEILPCVLEGEIYLCKALDSMGVE